MSIRPFRDIKRRVTKVINVGKVKIGGTNPISVQSMTNTLTKNVKETLNQINSISEVGGDIIRVSCPDQESTKALKENTQGKLAILIIFVSILQKTLRFFANKYFFAKNLKVFCKIVMEIVKIANFPCEKQGFLQKL